MNKLPNFDAVIAQMAEQAEEGRLRCLEIEREYVERAVQPHEIGSKQGPVHAASLLVWNAVAKHADIPHIPADVIAAIPMATAWRALDEPETLSAEEAELLKAALEWCDGRFWRTELCSSEGVKYALGRDGVFPSPELLSFSLDDCRIMDMHWGMPDIKVIGRPTVEPARVGGWPVEFRVFCGGQADTGAVSFYYPQAGLFDVTAELQEAMDQARTMGVKMHETREQLGLVPWLPGHDPDERIGSTIDFMLKSDGEIVMVDAGPGFGCGAHPCCFIDTPVTGQRWRLAEGVELR